MAKKKKTKKNKNFSERIKKPSKLGLPEETQSWIWAILMSLVAILMALSFFDRAGLAGRAFMKVFSYFLGKTIFLLPLIFLLAALIFFALTKGPFLKKNKKPIFLVGLILVLGISGILGTLDFRAEEEFRFFQAGRGGWLGNIISWPLFKLFGFWAAEIIFGVLIIIGGVISFRFLSQLPRKEKIEKAKEEKPPILPVFKRTFLGPRFKIKEVPSSVKVSGVKPLIPPLERKKPLEGAELLEYPSKITGFSPPPLDLLEADRGAPSAGDIKVNSAIIKKTLENFGILVEMSEVNIGPTVTQYAFKPAEGVKLSKITTLSNDLALALAAHPIRIEAPIPGRSLVGIEVPNKVRTLVRLRNLLENPLFQNSVSSLVLALGRDVSNNPVFADLGRMPHFLVAGSTGAGKTCALNSLILALLYRNSPANLRFILIDPKRVEFPIYNELPHLLCPVILDAQKTVNVLKWLISEMERRFQLLAELKAKDIASYNDKVSQKEQPNQNLETLPYIVLIIDELADLMAARGREVEAGVVRLAQMSRAVGIHLVVATQRPSVEVITGLIKANITSRISFQVASQVDSRTVLDMAGAEKLLGLGDMLFLSAERTKTRRLQGTYVSEKEVKKVVGWLKSKYKLEETGEALTLSLEEDLEKEPLEGGSTFYGEEDPLYEEAKKVVVEAKKASASLLQRRLRIGYARAARLIDILEARGVVGPGEGAKPRKVYLFPGEEDGSEI